MRAQVSKWGNSLAIRLPKSVVESLSVREGQRVVLAVEGDALIVKADRPTYTLEELVAQMRPEDAPEILDDPGEPPAGEEVL